MAIIKTPSETIMRERVAIVAYGNASITIPADKLDTRINTLIFGYCPNNHLKSLMRASEVYG